MKIYEFRMTDRFNWPVEDILKEARVAAERRMEIEFAGESYTIDSVHIENSVSFGEVTQYDIVVLGQLLENTVKLYEFTISDQFNRTLPEIMHTAEEAAKEEAEFAFQCSQGTDEWIIERVEMEGLPVASNDKIIYKFVVYGKALENINGNCRFQ